MSEERKAMKERVLAIVPARSGSLGVPNKNLRPLCGKPLLVWTVECALESDRITDVVVSTDSEKIRDVAVAAGAEGPFLRPAELATADALVIPALQHAVREMEKQNREPYDYVVMLQPTSPLKRAGDVDGALGRLIAEDADGIISVREVENDHPMKMKKFTGTDGRSGELVDYEKPPFENPPRQLLPPVYMVNGAIYAVKRDVLMNEGSLKGRRCLGYVMPAEEAANIDTEVDFVVAEHFMKQRLPAEPIRTSRSNAQLQSLYEQVFAAGKDDWFTFPTLDCTAEVAGALDWTGLDVLEVGCGIGDTAAALAAEGARVTAIDYAASAIEEAIRIHGSSGVDFRVASLESIDGAELFDAVVLQEVMEHMDEPALTLKQIAARLKEDGRIVITSPAFLNMRGYVWMTLQILFGVPMSLSDIQFITPDDMQRWAQEADLEMEQWHSFRHGQAVGAGMVRDMRRRLTNALRDAGMDNSRVDELLEWLLAASAHEQELKHNGAKMLYVLKRPVEASREGTG